jgi:hypothetical protein
MALAVNVEISRKQKSMSRVPFSPAFSLTALLFLTMLVASFFGGWQAHVWYLAWKYRNLSPIMVEYLEPIDTVIVR